jgi:uncharacterized protein
MDDGVVLAARVVHPCNAGSGARAAGPFPVVVEFTAYVKLGVEVAPIGWFAQHGYISVLVWARGTGGSTGEVDMYARRDGLDGKAIVEWAARLPGSDGRVALVGCSYPAGLALCTAAAVGPRSPLKAVVAAYNGVEGVVRGSWMTAGLLTGGFRYAAGAAALQGDTPAARSFYESLAAEIRAGGDAAYERRFWQQRLPLATAREIARNDVPVLLWSGWRDILDTAAMRCYTGLQNASRGRSVAAPMEAGQSASPRWQLVMGDWQHTEGLDLGIWLQWLETWVRGIDTGLQHTRTPLHLYEGGTARWVNASAFPLVDRATRWYLGGEHALQEAQPASTGRDTLSWGPPTQAGTCLAYTTPPLRAGATIAGPVALKIHAASSNTNLVLIAKLYDIAADGSAALVTKGAVLGSQARLDEERSWRDGEGALVWPYPALERDEPLTPGDPVCLDIALAPAQWGVRPGHRLRLELGTQNPAEVCDNPALNSNPCGLTGPQEASVPGGIYTILHGPGTPSCIVLPLLPCGHFAAVRAGATPTAWSDWKRMLRDSSLTVALAW